MQQSFANSFSTTDPNCPIVSYTCQKVVTGLPDSDCDYSDSLATFLSFDENSGSFSFESGNQSNAEYPPGQYTFRITAKAGSNSDIEEYEDFTLDLLQCFISVDQLIWNIPIV